VKLKEINSVQTIEELEALNIGDVHCDISYRGGGIGFYRSDLANALNIPETVLPRYVGAYSNYLGGGLRGYICTSGHGKVNQKAERYLCALEEACKRVYLNLENESGLNDEEDENGETNWDAIGTNASRRAGTVSAY
jgi:hypothetical protein